MKKLAYSLLIIAAACSSRGGGPTGSETGATSPEAAVNAYMAAMKARDLQAMSAVWGSARGSVRETMSRENMERSGTIVMGLLCPEDFRITSNTVGDEGRRHIRGQMQRGTRSIEVSFITIRGPDSRWYVEDVPLQGDLPQRLQAFCR
jgi:hypothetical protein